MNKRKLNAVMQLHGESQQNLADYLQMSLSRLNAKINEYRGAQFRQNEIAAIQEHYGLSAEEVNEIFFASLVSQKDTADPPKSAGGRRKRWTTKAKSPALLWKRRAGTRPPYFGKKTRFVLHWTSFATH